MLCIWKFNFIVSHERLRFWEYYIQDCDVIFKGWWPALVWRSFTTSPLFSPGAPTLGSCLLTFLHDTQWYKGWLHSTSLVVTIAENCWGSYWNETIASPATLRNCQHYWHCEDERVTEIFFPHFKKMSTYYTVCCCWTAWGCFMILNILKPFRNKRQINI